MSQIIRDGALVKDDWTAIDDEAKLPPEGRLLISLKRWQESGAELEGRELGVRLPNTADVDEFAAALAHWTLIALEFPAFGDGRAMSQARVLRDRLGFTGEIRATGEVLRDQMFYMRRCGINAFALSPGRDPDAALAALEEFGISYQPATDSKQTIFRRRATAT